MELLVSSFEEHGVQEDSNSRQEALLIGSCVFREVHIHCYCIRENLCESAFWLFENNTDVFTFFALVTNRSWINAERCLAAPFSAGVSFCTAIHAETSTAQRRVNQIQVLVLMVVDLHGRNAEPAGLFDASEIVVVAREGGLLVAAAFATSCTTTERAINTYDLSICIEFLDSYFIVVAWSTAPATDTGSVFKRMKNLVVSNKILEFSLGFASKYLL